MALARLPLDKVVKQVSHSGPPISLLVIQPDLPRGERWVAEIQGHNLERVAIYTDKALANLGTRIDAVVRPENLLTSAIDASPQLSEAVQSWVDRWNTPLITGMVRSTDDSAPNRYRSSIPWYVPINSSWLNLIERFFRDLDARRLRRGVFQSGPDLIDAAIGHVEAHNDDPCPFVRAKTAEEIVEKVGRVRRALVNAPTG